jgi:membrane protein DedA with SNARE-associated domain
MLSALIQQAAAAIERLLIGAGPAAVMLVALAENLFPPTPSEFLYPFAGKLAFDQQIAPWIIIAAGVAGSMIGAAIYYSLGWWLGEDRVRAGIARWGTVRLGRFRLPVFTVEGYDRALALFDRYGSVIVCVGRVMPLVHGIVSLPAGVVRMPLIPFFTYSALGALLWIAPLTLLGYWLGDRWEQALAWLNAYETAWYIAIFVGVSGYVIYRLRARKKAVERT